MILKAKIVNRYSIETIDPDEATAIANHRYKQGIGMFLITPESLAAIYAKPESDRTEKETAKIQAYERIESDYKREIDRIAEFLPFVQTGPPEIGDQDSTVPIYVETRIGIMQTWETMVNDPIKIKAKIETLKKELAASDYKIIKQSEASMTGQPIPAEMESVVQERQKLRDKINELQTL